jgi:hypothetical protein
MCHSKLLEALVKLANESRAGGENQHPQSMRDGGGSYGGYLVSLTGSGGALHHNTAVASVDGSGECGQLLTLVWPQHVADSGEGIQEARERESSCRSFTPITP